MPAPSGRRGPLGATLANVLRTRFSGPMKIATLHGIVRCAIAAGAGAAVAFGLPPWSLIPLIVVGFTVLGALVQSARRPRVALRDGWGFGMGFFLVGINWIGSSFAVGAPTIAWLAPAAVALLAAGLSIFPALASWVAWRFGRDGLHGIGVLAVSWTAFEWLRGTVLTGFPWNLVGYAWVPVDTVIQSSAYVGIYGLSLLTVFLAGLPAVLVSRPRRSIAGTVLVVMAVGTGGLHVAGAARLRHAAEATAPGVKLRLVQPNIPQSAKWDPSKRDRHFRRLVRMSQLDRPDEAGTRYVIWPESAYTRPVNRKAERVPELAPAIPQNGVLIAGANTFRRGPAGARVWNSALVLAPDAEVLATYDKFHLVPFGEYMPLGDFLGLNKLTEGGTDFTAGDGPRAITLPGPAPAVGPLICYEIIFPGAVTPPGSRPGWLLNLTNDAWFGDSAGPRQHFAMARVRAIEQGLPVVRVANTGISGVIDAYGRVRTQIELLSRRAATASLPTPIERPPPFARFGHWITLTMLLFGAALCAAGRIRPQAAGVHSRLRSRE